MLAIIFCLFPAVSPPLFIFLSTWQKERLASRANFNFCSWNNYFPEDPCIVQLFEGTSSVISMKMILSQALLLFRAFYIFFVEEREIFHQVNHRYDNFSRWEEKGRFRLCEIALRSREINPLDKSLDWWTASSAELDTRISQQSAKPSYRECWFSNFWLLLPRRRHVWARGAAAFRHVALRCTLRKAPEKFNNVTVLDARANVRCFLIIYCESLQFFRLSNLPNRSILSLSSFIYLFNERRKVSLMYKHYYARNLLLHAQSAKRQIWETNIVFFLVIFIQEKLHQLSCSP